MRILAALLLFLIGASAFAQTTINFGPYVLSLITASPPTGAEFLYINQGGNSRKITLAKAVGNAQEFNVRMFGAVGDGLTSDTIAFQNTFSAAQSSMQNTGVPAVVVIPPGVYSICSMATLTQPVSIRGDGSMMSIIKIRGGFCAPEPMFSWSDVWLQGALSNPNSGNPLNNTAGVNIEGISIWGNNRTLNPLKQSGFIFYDRVDMVYMRDVSGFYLPGSLLRTGVMKNQPEAYTRESRFYSLRCYYCGIPGRPVIDIGSDGAAAGDGTNQLQFFGVDIYDYNGEGMQIHNNGNRTVRNIQFHGVRIEAGEGASSLSLLRDGLLIGSTVEDGAITNIDFYGIEILANSPTKWALHIAMPNAAAGANLYGIRFHGGLLNNEDTTTGGGVNIQAGRSISMNFDLSTAGAGTDMTVGPTTAGVGNLLSYDGNGAESALTYDIDPSVSLTLGPINQFFRTVSATFSKLPDCIPSNRGTTATVSDSTTAVWGATITGSGFNPVMAYCNGSNWTVAGK